MTEPQHMKALKKANRIRVERGKEKRAIAGLPQQAARERVAALILTRPTPWHMESMTVCDLLGEMRRWGDTRVGRFLGELRIAETRTLVSLTDRQRGRIVEQLLGQRPAEPVPDVIGDYRRARAQRRDQVVDVVPYDPQDYLQQAL